MEYLKYLPLVVLLIITMSARFSSETIQKLCGKKFLAAAGGFYVYTAGASAVCCVCIAFLYDLSVGISLSTALLGILFGVVTMLSLVMGTLAIANGPWAYTTVLISLSSIIPTLSGAIFWSEKLSVLKIVGIVFMIICFILSVQNKDKDAEKKRATFRWLIFALVSALATGGIGVLQKIQGYSSHQDEVGFFLLIAFGFSAVCSLAIALFLSKKNQTVAFFTKKIKDKRLKWIFVALLGLAGLSISLNHALNLYLSSVMESAVFFPLVNGGNLILVTLLSIVVYKEKLAVKQWIGLACGSIAVICLCL